MDRVKHRVRTCYLQRATYRYQQHVWLIAAVFLVEKAAWLGKIHGLAAGNIFQEDNGVSDSTLRTDDQAFHVTGFLGIGIADLGVLADCECCRVRYRPGPLDRTIDGSAIRD